MGWEKDVVKFLNLMRKRNPRFKKRAFEPTVLFC